jgi:hypothetical protein
MCLSQNLTEKQEKMASKMNRNVKQIDTSTCTNEPDKGG